MSEMTIQTGRIELRQNKDLVDIGVNTVGDRNVNQPVLTAQWYGWLGPKKRKRKQTRTRSTAEDNGNTISHLNCGDS